MWTASCVFRLDGILVDSLDVHARVWERIAEKINGEQSWWAVCVCACKQMNSNIIRPSQIIVRFNHPDHPST